MNQLFWHSLTPALLGALVGLFTVNAVEVLSPSQMTAQHDIESSVGMLVDKL